MNPGSAWRSISARLDNRQRETENKKILKQKTFEKKES